MKFSKYDTSGVKYYDKRQCWAGTVKLEFKDEDLGVVQSLEVTVRARGHHSQSYQEAQKAIQDQAVLVLSQAKNILDQNTPEELRLK